MSEEYFVSVHCFHKTGYEKVITFLHDLHSAISDVAMVTSEETPNN
jgi:hypothetical protein